MKKFKFTLQTIHNVREMRQEKEEQVLSKIQSKINFAKLRLSDLEKLRFVAIENYTQKLKSGNAINPFEMELNTNHFASLDRSIREAKAEIEVIKYEYLEQSRVLATANQQVKITERLHENQKSRYRTELDRTEQTAIDELVSANYARQMLITK